MKKTTVLKLIVYGMSAFLVMVAMFLLGSQAKGNMADFGDIAETTGTILEFLLGFEMILMVAVFLLKHKLIPQAGKRYFVMLTKFIREYHCCVGFLVIGVLTIHFGLTIDFMNLWTMERITGYLTAVAIIFSIIAGLFYQHKKQKARIPHIVFALIGVIPFLLHIM